MPMPPRPPNLSQGHLGPPGRKFAISRPVRQGLLRQVQQSSLHQVKQSLLRQVQKKIAYFIHPTLMECETPLLRTLYQSSFFLYIFLD